MLIVEGPDGVGKTTLCRKLLTGLPGYIYAHFTRLPEGFDYYWGYLERASRRVVQDRFHLSEIVYAKARSNVSPLDPETYRLVDAGLRRLGAYTVLVTADEAVVRGRWDAGQMYDVDLTIRAARYFTAIGRNYPGSPPDFPDYRPDVDFTCHCTPEDPYVPDDAVGRILDEYCRRQDTVTRVAGRRSPEV